MRAKGQEGCQTAGCVIDLIKSKSKPKTRTVCWLKGAVEKEECASEVVKGVRERERETRRECWREREAARVSYGCTR